MLGPDTEGAAPTETAAAAAPAVADELEGVGSSAVGARPGCGRVGGSTVRLSRPENRSAGKGTEPELHKEA